MSQKKDSELVADLAVAAHMKWPQSTMQALLTFLSNSLNIIFCRQIEEEKRAQPGQGRAGGLYQARLARQHLAV